MHVLRIAPSFAWLAVSALLAVPAAGTTLTINYSTDTSNFFGAGNPQGAAAGTQARAALEAAAGFYSNILNDTLSAIQTPATFHGTLGGTVNWHWTATFPHPATGIGNALVDLSIPADQYTIYVGARSVAGSVVGLGAPGGFSCCSVNSSGNFTPQEANQIDAITDQFVNAVTKRGETSGFSRWGGSIAFDSDAGTNWHFNHTTPPTAGTTDFYSVALHEMAHTLGFGSVGTVMNPTVWDSLLSGTNFIGATAQFQYGGPVPLESAADKSHWKNGTASRVFGGLANQETLMDPSLNQAARKLVTRVDAAALIDMGWEIVLPGVVGDYNNSGIVDAADYTVWRDKLGTSVTLPNDSTPGTVTQADYTVWKSHFGQLESGAGAGSTSTAAPEPSGLALLVLGAISVMLHRRRQEALAAIESRTCASHSSLGGP